MRSYQIWPDSEKSMLNPVRFSQWFSLHSNEIFAINVQLVEQI